MFNPMGFSPYNTYTFQPALQQDTQASEKINSRSIRSLDQIAPESSINDNGSAVDKSRRRNGGGLDSLGRGNLL